MSDSARTVFVLDDDADVRRALTRLLRSAGHQVRAFESPQAFLAESHDDIPGCLLLDLELPGIDGLELQRALVGSHCARPVVFLTGRGDIHASVSAMKAGAVDFLTKPFDVYLLFDAIERALSLDATQRAARASHLLIQQRVSALTPRERQVLERVVSGRLNKQIAADLGTGEKTVKVHRARVMSKMGAHSVAELVQLASRAGVSMKLAVSSSNTPA